MTDGPVESNETVPESKENPDNGMDVEDGATSATKKTKSNGFRLERNEKQKQHKASRIQKGGRSHKKPRNTMVFAKTGRAKTRSKR